jgi:BirA family biotin operon repressor/biotin-[acetyl-CoA-carboxylase] ligase
MDRNPASMALRAGLAVSLALEEFHVPAVGIKWPNDIYVDGAKVCGVLVEADPRWFYIGIGLNVRDPAIPAGALGERTIAAPGGVGDLLPDPVGIHSVTHMIDRKLMETLTARDWADRVRPRLVWSGRPVRLQMDTSPDITGVLSGIDEDGALLILESRSERPQRYLSGTLRSADYS